MMRSLGVIVEYNPMHNGHLYHLKKSKELTGAEVVIAVMSGHFTQRGEPAIATKWERTKMALDGGVDLVVELPYAYSNQSADLFALGAISILSHLKVDEVVFGSESGDINHLLQLAKQLEDVELNDKIKAQVKKGHSLPQALKKSDSNYTGSNNTLGISYIKAKGVLNAPFILHTFARAHSNHTDTEAHHPNIASATAIRKKIISGDDYLNFTPYAITAEAYQTWASHYPYLRHKLLTTPIDQLRHIHDMIEGIENRLVKAAKSSDDFDTFMKNIKTKRYTKTRLQRICANVLTGTMKKDMTNWQLSSGAPYVRVLGFNDQGARYLKHVKKQVEVPIYSSFNKDAHPMFLHELKVTAAYGSILSPASLTDLLEQEYKQTPIRGRST